jgi:tetratricopeptide (TPR) repeat protein
MASSTTGGGEGSGRAAEYKQQGNELFAKGAWKEAIDKYSRAIELDPRDKVFYSNRSAAYLKLGDSKSKALKDGEKCVELDPSWPKAYSRLGAAQHALKRYDAAVNTFREGMRLDPDNSGLKEALRESLRLLKEGEDRKKLCAHVVESPEEFRDLIKSTDKVLTVADFSATWCGPCKQVSPFYDELAKKYPKVRFLKLLETNCQELMVRRSCCTQLGERVTPTTFICSLSGRGGHFCVPNLSILLEWVAS